MRQTLFGYHDNAGCWHEVVQLWARIPATGVWMIVETHEREVDPATAPAQPTRPA